MKTVYSLPPIIYSVTIIKLIYLGLCKGNKCSDEPGQDQGGPRPYFSIGIKHCFVLENNV